MLGKLPVYKGYTIDYRCKEFRKINWGELPEWIPFDSDKGDRLLCELIKKDLIPQDILVNLF